MQHRQQQQLDQMQQKHTQPAQRLQERQQREVQRQPQNKEPKSGRHVTTSDPTLRAQFILGDFAVTAASMPDADIVTLDRVVCCYPDVDAILEGAAARWRHMIAFTYPHNTWYVRAVENSWYRLRHDEFRAFVHSLERMGLVLESAGFVRAARHATLQWALEFYRRRL
jgi:hypothetical protein